MTHAPDRDRNRAAALANAGAYLAGMLAEDLRGCQRMIASYVVEHIPEAERADALRELLELLGIYVAVGEHFTCGTLEGYRWHVAERGETPCQPCWNARIRELEEMWSRECPMIPLP